MSRNRMKNSQSLHWMGVVKWIMIAAILACLGLFYMLSKNYNLNLAEETHKLQLQSDRIAARNSQLNGDLLSMKSLKLLQARLVAQHSTLVTWNDTRANWVRLDQNPRARLAQMGTMPKASLNFDSSVVAANASTPPSPVR